MTPTVSVLVSSYNYGRFIGAALESVRAQTFQDFEVVVVDDGSTDNTLEVLAEFLADPRFRLVRQEHGGAPKAKNRALVQGHGRYLAFLDADDRWRPTKLARQLDLFAANPHLGVVFTRRAFIDSEGQPIERGQADPERGDIVNAVFRQNFICFSSALVARTAAEHIGLFDPGLPMGQDYDFWLRIARQYRVDYVDEPLTEYRLGHVSLSRRLHQRLHTALYVMERFRRHYDTPGVLDPRTVRRSEAETFAHMGLACRPHSAFEAAAWFLRAVWRDPTYRPGYRDLLAALVPTTARQFARRWLRRSGAWEQSIIHQANRPEPIH